MSGIGSSERFWQITVALFYFNVDVIQSLNVKNVDPLDSFGESTVRRRRQSIGQLSFTPWSDRDPNDPNIIVIPYLIKGEFTHLERAVIEDSIRRLNKNICVNFREIPNGKPPNDRSYLIIDNIHNGKCNSHIGADEAKGFCVLNLDTMLSDGTKTCVKSHTVTHELMHVLGMQHEHFRPDAKKSITIHADRIQKHHLSQFIRDKAIVTYGTPFSYLSIMLYNNHKGSLGGNITITTADPRYNEIIGYAPIPHWTDYAEACSIYSCARCMRQTFRPQPANSSVKKHIDFFPDYKPSSKSPLEKYRKALGKHIQKMNKLEDNEYQRYMKSGQMIERRKLADVRDVRLHQTAQTKLESIREICQSFIELEKPAEIRRSPTPVGRRGSSARQQTPKNTVIPSQRHDRDRGRDRNVTAVQQVPIPVYDSSKRKATDQKIVLSERNATANKTAVVQRDASVSKNAVLIPPARSASRHNHNRIVPVIQPVATRQHESHAKTSAQVNVSAKRDVTGNKRDLTSTKLSSSTRHPHLAQTPRPATKDQSPKHKHDSIADPKRMDIDRQMPKRKNSTRH